MLGKVMPKQAMLGTGMLMQASYSAEESAGNVMQLEVEPPAAAAAAGTSYSSSAIIKESKQKRIRKSSNEPKKEKIGGLERLKGVFSCKNSTKFKAQVQIDKRPNYLGLYNTREEAAQAYDNYIIGEHGVRAKTNYHYSDGYMLSVYQNRQQAVKADRGMAEATAVTVVIPSPVSSAHAMARNMETIYPGDTIALSATVNAGGELSLNSLCDKLMDLAKAEVAANIGKLHRTILEVEPVSIYWKRQFFLWKGTVMSGADRTEIYWRGSWLASFFEPSLEKVCRSKSKFEYKCVLAVGKQVETREIPNRSIPNTYFLPVDGEYMGKYVSFDEDSGSSMEFVDRALVLEFRQFDKSNGATGFYEDDDDKAGVDRQIDVDFPLFRVSGDGIDSEDNHFVITGTYNSYTQFLEVRRNYCLNQTAKGAYEKDGVRFCGGAAPVIVDQSMICEDELDDDGSDEDEGAMSSGLVFRRGSHREENYHGRDFRAPLVDVQSEESNSRSRWDV